MRASDIKAILGDARARAARELGEADAAVVDALIAVVDRLAEGSSEQLVERLSSIKAPRRTSVASSALDQSLVDNYVGQLARLNHDHAATLALVAKMRADRKVKKPEAIAIAKASGVRTNSKTTKVQAMLQVEGISSARERDRQTAERIRKGA